MQELDRYCVGGRQEGRQRWMGRVREVDKKGVGGRQYGYGG